MMSSPPLDLCPFLSCQLSSQSLLPAPLPLAALSPPSLGTEFSLFTETMFLSSPKRAPLHQIHSPQHLGLQSNKIQGLGAPGPPLASQVRWRSRAQKALGHGSLSQEGSYCWAPGHWCPVGVPAQCRQILWFIKKTEIQILNCPV